MAEKDKPQSSGTPILNIVGELVALGPLREDLLPVYGRWINDFATIRMLGLLPRPVTAEKERDWYEDRSKAENDLRTARNFSPAGFVLSRVRNDPPSSTPDAGDPGGAQTGRRMCGRARRRHTNR